MALKILGQIQGSGAIAALYQCAAGKAAVISSVIVCNTHAATAKLFKIYQTASAPGATTVAHMIFQGTLPAGESYVVVAGLSLDQNEYINVFGEDSNLTFTCSGDET